MVNKAACFVGGFIGSLIICVGVISAVFLLFIVITSLAEAHEQGPFDPVDVRVIPDRSFIYKPQDTQRIVATTIYITAAEHTVSGCAPLNDTLYASIKNIAKAIVAHPETGYVYKDTLDLIHSMWCTE